MTGTKMAAASGLAEASELRAAMQDRGMLPGSDARTGTRRTWSATLLPYTGKEFLDSLDDGREVWIYGERVRNVGEHPAFRNTARMLARLYDALHRDHAAEKDLLTYPTE
jgi:hypothetical protein